MATLIGEHWPGSRMVLDVAVRHSIRMRGRAEMRASLKQGYRDAAEHDLEIVAEWFPLEEEAWEKS